MVGRGPAVFIFKYLKWMHIMHVHISHSHIRRSIINARQMDRQIVQLTHFSSLCGLCMFVNIMRNTRLCIDFNGNETTQRSQEVAETLLLMSVRVAD